MCQSEPMQVLADDTISPGIARGPPSSECGRELCRHDGAQENRTRKIRPPRDYVAHDHLQLFYGELMSRRDYVPSRFDVFSCQSGHRS